MFWKGQPMPSEWDKMVSGQLYNPLDPAVFALRRRARDLTKAYNDTGDAEQAERGRVLGELIGHAGKNLWIEPPFFCDYGANITVGDNVFFNCNCVVLDVAPATIGDHVLFGPAVQIYTATHPMSARERRTGLEAAKPIDIASDVWLGGACIILPGVRIGGRGYRRRQRCHQGHPAGVFAAGNPCRVIRELTD
jgi:maltose O-acetyltransferase